MPSWRRCIIGILAVLTLLVFVVLDMHYTFAEERAAEYYRRAPYMLLIPICIGFLVGFSIWLLTRVPTEPRRRIFLVFWALANGLGTCAVGYLFYLFVSQMRLEGSGLGKIVAENARSTHLKYIFGCIAVTVGILVTMSWRALFRAQR